MKYHKFRIFIFISMIMNCWNIDPVFAQENIIKINVSREAGRVNKLIFGANVMGYDPGEERHGYAYADYGGGLWNPYKMKTVPEVINLAKNINLSFARFNTNSYYKWQRSIGSKRNHFLYGVNEFLKSSEEIGAVPGFIIGYFTESAQDAADFVEYLNTPCVDDTTWAGKRAEYGHPDPYNVKYFEIGNEVFEPEYGRKYIDYYNAMKSVDPSVQIGAVLYTSEWNRTILQQIGDKVDFGIIHMYPSPLKTIDDRSIKEFDPSDLFKFVFAMPAFTSEPELQKTLKLMREKTGKDIPLAITEFNIGFSQSEPVIYRHTLGASLVNAELLQIFMKPENRVVFATNHHFADGAWGMIRASGDLTRKQVRYFRRPNYYVYELYNKHFGEVLLDVQMNMMTSYNIEDIPDLKQSVFKIQRGAALSGNLLDDKWEITTVKGIRTELNNNVLNIDFENTTQFNYYHATQDAKIMPDTYYRLSGYIKTDELIDREGISLNIADGRGWNETKSAAVTDRITGTNDWQHVEVLYKTLPDAKSVQIMARRTGMEGPLKGRVSIKDVRLEEFKPDTSVPYLSISASKSIDGRKIYVMVINKNLDDGVTATIELENFVPSESAHVWILNGPSVIATNEKFPHNVKISHKDITIKKQPFQFTFEPHSVTAMELISNDFAHEVSGLDINLTE